MKTWWTRPLFILLFGGHFLLGVSSFAQTLQAPERDVREAPRLPNRAEKTLKTRRVQEAFPCEAVYAEMRRSFENLEQRCSDPSGFSGETLRLYQLRTQWVENRCAEKDMDAGLKRDAFFMLKTGIESAQVRCVESCFQKATDLIETARCQAAGVQCRDCCAFSLPLEGRTCGNRCDAVERECRERLYEFDVGFAQKGREYRDSISELARTMHEIALAVSRSLY